MAYTSTQAHLLDELRRIDAILNAYEETQQAHTTDERPEIEPQTVVDELLNGAAETGNGIAQTEDIDKNEDGDDADDSSGLLSRLFGG